MDPSDKGIESSDLEVALNKLTVADFENANWPVISFASVESFSNEDEGVDQKMNFWKQVLNPENFLQPNNENKYSPNKDLLFILHSFNDDKGNECIFKAISTSKDLFIQDPVHILDYRFHGQPCEIRSKGVGGSVGYPKCDFWKEFYDNLPVSEQGTFRIPTREWRKRFIQEKY